MVCILNFMVIFCNFREGKIFLNNTHAGVHQFSVHWMTPRGTNYVPLLKSARRIKMFQTNI